MKHWVANIHRHTNFQMSTEHLEMHFSFAEKSGKNLYDTYENHFEIHFQATNKYNSQLDTELIGPTEWYAMRFTEIKPQNADNAMKAIKKIVKEKADSPVKVLTALNGKMVKHIDGHDYWIKEVYTDTLILRSPLEIQRSEIIR